MLKLFIVLLLKLNGEKQCLLEHLWSSPKGWWNWPHVSTSLLLLPSLSQEEKVTIIPPTTSFAAIPSLYQSHTLIWVRERDRKREKGTEVGRERNVKIRYKREREKKERKGLREEEKEMGW